MNTIITKEKASCIFYRKKYTSDVANECTSKIERMEDVDLCFTTNALHHCIMSEATIYGDLQQYHLYTTAKELEESNNNDKEDDGIIKFETRAQIKEFINAAFQPVTEKNFNDDRFSKQKLSTESIFTIVHRYTSEFKTDNSFSTWCSTAGFGFLLVECSRKTLKGSKGEKGRNRLLNVLKQKHHAHLAKTIASALIKYQSKILDMKKKGFTIVGYCRKSVQKRKSKKQVELLQAMVNNLYERSLADYVFVSPMNNANSLFSSRDLECDMNILSELKSIHGISKDMLHLITNRHKVCLVTCDYAGLTTNNTDLQAVLTHNVNIEKIAVDLYYYDNRFDMLDRNDLLKDPSMLSQFGESRTAFKQRHL
ncbi:uncharacterized protein BX663DRAFT_501741 [Cokeromyces recurvatus]|uniref:uncharacterized protein n=1 Tax=Cokeromyces recurvatus TaxID=90255 RepID=UPI00221E6A32|nr:uncharacterized protein BX663DRAFT_501741 [Cokeromyces recurvatus]KAI7905104.1 hypothetical protein BX663DRAFT_501741 [Cokeromyces recurvatus]